jgi:hypothetical protein
MPAQVGLKRKKGSCHAIKPLEKSILSIKPLLYMDAGRRCTTQVLQQ